MPAPVLFAPETFNLAEVTRGIEVARRLATRRPVLFCGFSRRYADRLVPARAEARPLVYLKPFAYSAAHIATMRSTGLWPATGRWARSWDRAGAAAARAVLPRLRLLPPGWRRLAAQNGVRLPPSSTDFLE